MSSLIKATALFNALKSAASNFNSPLYKSYFTQLSIDNYNNLMDNIDKGKFKCVLGKYIKSNEELLDTLKRQSVIYNMYRDNTSNF